MSTESTYRDRRARAWVAVIVLLFAYNIVNKIASCNAPLVESRRGAPAEQPEPPYQSAVEEGLGAAVAILIDTSGSMSQAAPGDSRPKYVVAQEALDRILDATDAFIAKRPDFPIKIGVYSFSSHARTLLAIRPYDREAIMSALTRLPRPGGGTAIGEALRTARPDLYRAGVFRKYMIVVTDGENTSGRSPDEVAHDIYRRSNGAVQMYFVAFDTNPQKFAFLRDVGGDVFGASAGDELKTALDQVYQGKILAEAPGGTEREPVKR
jgi:VWA domain-containing protein